MNFEPGHRAKGKVWLNTDDGIMRVFNGSEWITGQPAIEILAEVNAGLESDLRASALERLSMMGENDRLHLALTKIATLDPMESAKDDNLWARKIAREAIGLGGPVIMKRAPDPLPPVPAEY